MKREEFSDAVRKKYEEKTFEIGTEVNVVSDKSCHGFEIDEIVTLVDLGDNKDVHEEYGAAYEASNSKGRRRYLYRADFEVIEGIDMEPVELGSSVKVVGAITNHNFDIESTCRVVGRKPISSGDADYTSYDLLYTLLSSKGVTQSLYREDFEVIEDVKATTGSTRTFESGATRNSGEGKLEKNYFLHVKLLHDYSKWMNKHQTLEDGTTRQGNNWYLGLDPKSLMQSMMRHHEDARLHYFGYPNDTTETYLDSLYGVIFNAFGLIHAETVLNTTAVEHGMNVESGGADV